MLGVGYFISVMRKVTQTLSMTLLCSLLTACFFVLLGSTPLYRGNIIYLLTAFKFSGNMNKTAVFVYRPLVHINSIYFKEIPRSAIAVIFKCVVYV